MNRQRRLAHLEARVPEPEEATARPLTPRAINAAAQALIRKLKAGTAEPVVLRCVPELLRSEHVPQELKEELETLWCSWKPERNKPL